MFRIDEIVVGLVEVEACDINQIDGFGNTPLLLAVLNGTSGENNFWAVRRSSRKAGFLLQTSLGCAFEHGRLGVVKILLGRYDVNPEMLGPFGQTPLSCAAEHGRAEVVNTTRMGRH